MGWGECVAEELPLYSEEWTETAWPALERILGPMIIAADLDGPESVRTLFSPVRGNRMAKAAIESAVWDLEARRQNIPLWQLLGGTHREIPSGVSIGLKASTGELLQTIEREITAGSFRLVFVAPEEGQMIWADNMLVPNLATHQDNAERWIDYYYDPEVAAKLAAYVWYICPVKGAQEAMEKVDPSLVENPLIFPTAESLATTHTFMALEEFQVRAYEKDYADVTGG